jgi:hypothetical protein
LITNRIVYFRQKSKIFVVSRGKNGATTKKVATSKPFGQKKGHVIPKRPLGKVLRARKNVKSPATSQIGCFFETANARSFPHKFVVGLLNANEFFVSKFFEIFAQVLNLVRMILGSQSFVGGPNLFPRSTGLEPKNPERVFAPGLQPRYFGVDIYDFML